MDFIKKHYEKVLLGVVLLLATAAVGSLPFLIEGSKGQLKDQRDGIIKKSPKPLTNLDLTISQAVVKNLNTPLNADFTRPHNVFNPVQWQKSSDGKLIKIEQGNEIGPEAAVVVQTTPLYLVLTFDSTGPLNEGVPSGYLVGIERQAAASASARRKRQTFARLNEKKEDLITLREVKGPPEAPEALVVELSDSGDTVTFTKDKPYQRVEGYLADLRYDPEKKNFANRRVGDAILIAGEGYNIVAITEDEVVVSNKLTGKKATIRKKTD